MTDKNTKMTREEWLNLAKDRLEEKYFSKTVHKLPPVAVSCGIPACSVRAIGECWDSTCSERRMTEIFICPSISDPEEVIGVLLHELVHAQVGVKEGHGKVFKTAAKRVGLVGKATCCSPSPDTLKDLRPILDELGAYPHSKLTKTKKGKKKPTKKRVKLTDPSIEGYSLTAEWELIKAHGPPLSPITRDPLKFKNPEDDDE